MSKLLIMVIMVLVLVLLAFAACGGNGDGTTATPQQSQESAAGDTAQNTATDDVADDNVPDVQVSQTDSAGVIVMERDGSYTFTFGDSFIWFDDRWQITIGNEASFFYDERWELPIIKIPYTITRRYQAASNTPFGSSFQFNPGWPMEDGIPSQTQPQLLRAFSIVEIEDGVLPCFASNPTSGDLRLQFGETREHAIYMFYEGDGYYNIISGQFRAGAWADGTVRQLEFYITRP